jgi:LmbE family N-acetylglucosaminyl deacetylase
MTAGAGDGVNAVSVACVDGFPTSERAKVMVLVAHPDDETIWAGGTLLMHGEWEVWVGTLCRGGDVDRSSKFMRLLSRLGARGKMANLDDGPAQTAIEPEEIRTVLRSMLPAGAVDLVLTHAPGGEYTRHRRHEEVSRCVLEMWACGEIKSRELWLFAYDDDGGRRLPSADERAEILVELSEDVWTKKRDLLTEIYGFVPDSWEVRSTPRREAFYRLLVPDDARAWLERGKR